MGLLYRILNMNQKRNYLGAYECRQSRTYRTEKPSLISVLWGMFSCLAISNPKGPRYCYREYFPKS